MKIVIIEDNVHKRKKIKSFLDSNYDYPKIKEASSYSSGIEMVEGGTFDFLILDMTLPTYDITSDDGGGNFRVFGGKDILKRLKRKNFLLPFVVVTQYSTFSETTGTKSLEVIKEDISELFPDHCKGVIFYDTTSTAWKDELAEVLSTL